MTGRASRGGNVRRRRIGLRIIDRGIRTCKLETSIGILRRLERRRSNAALEAIHVDFDGQTVELLSSFGSGRRVVRQSDLVLLDSNSCILMYRWWDYAGGIPAEIVALCSFRVTVGASVGRAVNVRSVAPDGDFLHLEHHEGIVGTE